MYYYIAESPKNRHQKNLHEKIKNTLIFLGITGETVMVSPARTVEELSLMGLEKGYSTIVAIGCDELINQVASNIAGTGAVLGIIPIEASEDIVNLIGTSDIKTACDALQKRHLRNIDMAFIEPNQRFLTKATIHSPKLLQVQAEIDDYYIETKVNKIIIDYDLGIHLIDETRKKSWWRKILGLENKTDQLEPYSYLKAHRLRLRTNEIVPVKIGNATITKTPIVARQEPQILKIIMAYARM